MDLITRAPRGTNDILPDSTFKWQYIEEIIRQTAVTFNYKEIRFPTFEHTELFERGVGDGTDVVQKEMYTFMDKGDRSITLRPEGTASAARLILENGLYGGILPLKLYYLISCFRYEKPQAGRLREFHQFGIEQFGSAEPSADAEVISLANTLFHNLKIRNLSLEINSIGCPECRKKYQDALKQYFLNNQQSLCETCNDRMNKNPMRILDCKSPNCKEVGKNAPLVLDYICEDCSTHFEGLKNNLDVMNIKYTINPRIVRGLDYYNRTVFEFISAEIGAQGTVCGGGRYDGLTYELGKENICGLGFGLGLERILMLMEAQKIEFPDDNKCVLFAANIGQKGATHATKLVYSLRNKGISSEYDIVGRSLKAQMKYADKIGAKYTVVIGDNEAESGIVEVKNMSTGEKTSCKIDEIVMFLED